MAGMDPRPVVGGGGMRLLGVVVTEGVEERPVVWGGVVVVDGVEVVGGLWR